MKNGPYELVIAPSNYPGKKYRGRYVYEHHLVWWKDRNQIVPKGFNIHHLNGNYRDNTIQNLELISSAVHRRKHALDRQTRMDLLECFYCKCTFPRPHRAVKKDQTRFYCSRQHMGIVQWRDNFC